MTVPKEHRWPDVYRGVDARSWWPVRDVDLAASSWPYLWKARYSDESDEWGAGTLSRYLDDGVRYAEAAWEAVRPGGWLVLNLGDTRLNTGGSGGQVTKAGQRVYRQDRSHGIEGRQWANVPHQAAETVRCRTGWQFHGEVVWEKPSPVLADCSAYHMDRNGRPGLQHESLFFFWKPGGDRTWNTSVLVEHRDPDAVAAAEATNRAWNAARGLPAAERRRLTELGLVPSTAERDAVRRLAGRGTRAVLGSVWDLPKHTSEPPWSETADDVKAWPDALCERLVLLLTNPGDLCADPCGGYGSLVRTAEHLGRRGWASDLYWGRADLPGSAAAVASATARKVAAERTAVLAARNAALFSAAG